MTRKVSMGVAGLFVAIVCGQAMAATVPFEEPFVSDSAGWLNAPGTLPLDWVASGGSDTAGYSQTTFNFVNTAETGPMDQGPVIFRGGPGASGSAFVGDWLTEGVTAFSFYVRHDAAAPLNVFARLASPIGFPGAIGVDFTPALPNVWTQITIPIVDSLPPFVSYEGSNFNTVFSNIGDIRIGVNAPAGVAGVDTDVTFDLDQVSIVPEPASMILLAGGALAFVMRRRRTIANG